MKVSDWFDITVIVCGPDNKEVSCARPATASSSVAAAPPAPSGTRDVLLGSRLGVTLTAADPAVEVRDLVNPKDGIQPFTSRSDRGEWVWDVRATKPGTYKLRAAVRVVAKENEKDLVPRSETVTIRLDVERTARYGVPEVTKPIAKAAGWTLEKIAAFVIGLASAGAITTAMLIIAWRRFRRRGHDADGITDDLGIPQPPAIAEGNSSYPRTSPGEHEFYRRPNTPPEPSRRDGLHGG
ncbi:hypothetical protein [Micromonospora sp. NPDC005413]|uniref:hypothetical protein n=1 Tax=Micromonospora sp. NPDC005413 TaxID=3154563 RepID=UPI0033B3A6BB